MAAVAFENANKVWQRVQERLNLGAGVPPAIAAQFKALKQILSTQKGNQDLGFYAFTEVQCDVAGGTVLATGACKVLAIYIKKEASDTDNWFWLYDDATNDGTAADAMVALPLLITGEEMLFVHPEGLPIAAGLVVTQYATDPLGASDGSNGGNGFIIVKGA